MIHKVTIMIILLSVTMLCSEKSLAQDVYANQLTDSSSDFQFAYRVVDANKTNYGYLSNTLQLLNTSFIKVKFPTSGKAGDVVNVTVQSRGQILGLGLLNYVTIRLYDSLGNQVANSSSGSGALQLALLSSTDSLYNIRYITSIADTFKFKEAKIEFNNVLTANLFSQFRIYGVYDQVPCPPIYANAVYAYGTNGMLTGFVNNPNNAVDGDQSNYATMVTPLNILSILPPAYLDLSFPQYSYAGSYVGFTIGQLNSVLSVSLLNNIQVMIYDEAGNLRETKSNFAPVNLQLLDAGTNKYTLGFTSQPGNYRIARLRIQLNAVLSLLQNFTVYNSFQYKIDRPAVAITTSRSTNMCAGDSVTLTAENVQNATWYMWSNGATTRSIRIGTPGVYSVNVMDSAGCTRRSLDINVVINQAPNPVIVGDSVICDGRKGKLATSVKYSKYLWGGGATTDSINVALPAKYYVAVTDSNGCSATDSINVANNALNIVPTITNPTCETSQNGIISLNITGGSGSYTYRWSDGTTNSSLSNLKNGVYTAIVTDATQGCKYNRAYTIASTNKMDVKYVATNTSTCGAADASIDVDVVGGSGTYTYVWSNSGTAKKLAGVTAGIYNVTVTDGTTGCQKTETIAVEDGGNSLKVNATVLANRSCSAPNGSIALNVTGGSGRYSYLWNGGATTSVLAALPNTTYTVLVKDSATNCSNAERISVRDSFEMNIAANVTAAGCLNSTGAIALGVTGGTNNYQYTWSDGVTVANRTSVPAGTYIVTVRDNTSNCSSSKAIVVGEAAAPAVTLNISNPTCLSNNNGLINITTAGTYKYTWSNGAVSKNITGLAPGIYTVSVKDTVSNCVANYSAEIVAKPKVSIAASQDMFTSCTVSPNGAIKTEIMSGKTPITYLWSSNETTKNIINKLPGVYNVTITDSNSCQAIASFTIGTDSAKMLKAVVDTLMPASCATVANASVVVKPTGGKAPFTYLWSNTATTNAIKNVLPGAYQVNITDSFGCTVSSNVMVAVDTPNMLIAKLDSTIADGCKTLNKGAIYVTTIGGKMPYVYSWTNSGTSEDLTNLPSGNYTLTITDNVGCKAVVTANVAKDSILLATKNVNNISCYNQKNGSITLNVIANGQSVQYAWSNGANTNMVGNLAPGTYTVNVTDTTTGCKLSDTFTISQPDSLYAVLQSYNDDCYDANTGRVTVDVYGGTTPYKYNWSNGGTSANVSDVGAGTYGVTITDNNNCTVQKTADVQKDNCDFNIVVHNAITPNGDMQNDYLTIDGIQYYPNNQLYVFDKWGDIVYQKKGYNNQWNAISTKGDPLPDGTYYYVLKLNEQNKAGGKNEYTGFLMIKR